MMPKIFKYIKQILILFLLISILPKCFSQKVEIDFTKNRIQLVDSIAKIGYNRILYESIDTNKFKKFYDNSFAQNKERHGFVCILNKDKTQFFRSNSKLTDGYWN